MIGFLWGAVVAAVLFGLTGFQPLQSEDWIHLEIFAEQSTWLAAFDLHVSHARPLLFLPLWSMLPSGLDHAELMRIPLFAMHVVTCGLVGVLARMLGASPRRALLAVGLFSCFPAIKGLSWIIAISTPEHVMLMVFAMVVAVSHARRPRAATGVTLIATQVLAILSHSAASFLPGSVLVLAIGVSPRRFAILKEPWLLLHLLVGLVLVLVLASLPTDERYHSLRGLGAIAANGARALLSLFPEIVRGPAIEGLRGAFGPFGVAYGLLVCAGATALFVQAIRGGGPLVRALLLAALIDLVPPVLTAGFVVRYAYFPAALVSVALLLAARPTRRWCVLLALLATGWLMDMVVDVAEVRRGGALGTEVVEAARAVRAEVGPGVPVALLNPPLVIGAERDVYVFNWGLPVALRRQGVEGPWQFVRTVECVTTSDVVKQDAGGLERLVRGGAQLWEWDEAAARFVRR